MMTKKAALKEAGRFAATLDGPLGPRPMQRVVAEFLPFFHELRADGASWTQIASLLGLAGVRSSSGKAVTDNALRAMVSRAENEPPEGRGVREVSGTKPDTGIAGTHPRPLNRSPRRSPEISQPSGRLVPGAGLSDVRQRILRASMLRDSGSGSGR
jgi:hypothetical protein